MSLETIQQDILGAYQAAVAGIHAQFANTLAQAGHNVSEANTASELINSAVAVAQTMGKSAAANVAPNYADFALHAFMVSMERAAITFAAAHLPDKYKPVFGALSADVQDAIGGEHVSVATVVEDTTAAAGAAVEMAEPTLAPVVELAEPVVQREEATLLSDAPPVAVADEADPAIGTGATEQANTGPAVEAVPEAAAPLDKAGLLDDTH